MLLLVALCAVAVERDQQTPTVERVSTRRVVAFDPQPHESRIGEAVWVAMVSHAEQQAAALRASQRAKAVVRPKPRTSRGSGGGLLDCIARNEGNPSYSHNDGDPYDGRFQFDRRTFAGAVTRAGYPEYAGGPASDAPPHVQDAAARQLHSERGLQPWSAKARANC